MKLRAGLGLDSRRPNNQQSRMNEDVVGPEGLLKILEFWGGLVAPVQAHPQRVVQYRNALKAADSPTRFYHRSFASDPVATAETLLRWRDFAFNHGWTRKQGAQSPGRLADLADVENAVKGLAPCVGERVAALVPKLGLVKGAIDKIILMDARPDWPGAFQGLFKRLKSAQISISKSVAASNFAAPEGSDLGLLQRALARSEPGKSLRLRGDGTLHLYRCLNTHSGVNALCHIIDKHPNHLLIAGGDTFLLGLAARDRGFADPGLGEHSRWRPAHQLLPLVLQIAWSPPSAEALLQYLTLPVGRFRFLRRAIAKRFINLPGYDRDVWQEEIDAFVTRRLKRDPQLDEVNLRKQIDAWLRVAVAGSRDKMKRDLAIELVDQVRDYWRSRFGALNVAAGKEVEASQFLAAYQVADAIGAALRAWDDDEITREQLDRLLDLGVDAGAVRLNQPRQVSQLNCIERPESARLSLHTPESLFWWRPGMVPEVPPPPFDETEQAALPWLPDQSGREQQRQAALRRALVPLLTTTKRATLMITDDSVDLLRLYLDQHLPEHAWRSLDSDLIEGSQSAMPLSPVTDLPLPAPQRWWHIDRAVDCPRQRESYTGLSSLALSPHDYVLHYVAGLSAGSIAGVPVDQRLKGNLAHRLIEAWFTHHPWAGSAPDQAKISQWLDAQLDPMIEAKALPLAAPGKRAERLAFRETFAHALYRLLEHLTGAGARAVQVEKPLQCALTNFDLEGSIDLLVEIDKGEFAIIDVKWGGEKARIAELKEGRYLQLATYAHLVESKLSSQVVQVAYFILRSADLLTPSSQVFSKARVIKPEDPNVSPSTVWQCLIKTTQWRCDQLAQGQIEVTSSEAAPTQNSIPPSDCLPPLETAKDSASNGYNARRVAFKPIDPWRVLTGQIKE
jgi:ATP-dependent helicase/nuclease subunit B